MKKNSVLLPVGVLSLAAIALLADLPPRTLPPQPVRLPAMKSPGDYNGAEMRGFRVAGREYSAVLFHRDIKSSPAWNPAAALPLSLSAVEAIARAELNKLVTDAAEWETSNIELNRFAQSAEPKWYYAVTFSSVLRLTGVPPDAVIVLLTIDGKPGRFGGTSAPGVKPRR